MRKDVRLQIVMGEGDKELLMVLCEADSLSMAGEIRSLVRREVARRRSNKARVDRCAECRIGEIV
jgi:hypothetical protein